MEQFFFYLRQGFEHITDVEGLDHIVFIVTLCAVFSHRQWRHLLILVTAFTIGHSVSLALAALSIVAIDAQLVETLIPVTILLTSIYNVSAKGAQTGRLRANYALALGFGLIHGMGFSNFFSAMMMGIGESVILPLFSFNLGIELGQLIIVSVMLLVSFCCGRYLGIRHRDWNIYISGAGGGIAATMIVHALIS